MSAGRPAVVNNASESLSALQFMEALRGVVRFRQHPVIAEPLTEALRRIELNPAFAESRLLTRILVALADRQGEFRRAEIDSLDAATFAMVITLMDAHAAGDFTPQQLLEAVTVSNAAQVGAGG